MKQDLAFAGRLSKRIREVRASETVKTLELAEELRRQGKDIISLTAGPDRDTPSVIKDAAKNALDENLTRYGPVAGVPELRRAIAAKLEDENGIPAKEENILVSAGSKFATFLSVQALVNPGDEVVILDPAWPTYEACAAYTGAKVVRATLDSLSSVVKKGTKLLIVNTPNNPAGYVLTRQQSRLIADLSQDYDFAVLADEIYERITYDCEHISLASLDGMFERTVTIGGFSKSVSMTGWRLGYLSAPTDLVKVCADLQSNILTCASTFSQYAVARTMKLLQGAISEMVAEYGRRRDLVVDRLRDLGFECGVPEGAFYAWPKMFPPFNGTAMAQKLLSEAFVATTSGEAFGPRSQDHIRVSFANATYARILEAFDRISQLDL